MRQLIDTLRNRGELGIITRQVSGKFELAAVCQAAQRQSEMPLLFKNVEGSSHNVVTNIYGSRNRLCELIGADSGFFCKRWSELMRHEPVKKTNQKNIETNIEYEQVTLLNLPQITYQERDAGPYITSGVFLANDPESGVPNLSFHRAMHVNEHELRIRLGTSHHLTKYQLAAESQNQALEVAILIGPPTPYILAAAATIPKSDSEVELAMKLSQEPIPMRKCKFIDLEVPAASEFVIEGRILPNLRRPEGPFGEFKGLYIEREENHVIEVLGVTARANPYYHALLCGSPEDMRLLELSVATQIFQQLSNTLPGILDVSCVPNIMSTVVQIEQQYEGHARQVMLTVFGVNHDYSKSCIVVDDDVNINDFSDVYWACMLRASAENDISVISGVPGFYRDPDRDHWGRLGIDATKPWSRRKNFERTRVPDAHNIDLSNYLS